MIKPVLEDKRYIQYNRVSRYSVFPAFYNRFDNKYIYGLTSNLKKEGTSYVNHVITKDDTLDTLALYYYNSPLYFWIIADYNNILDPYAELEVGRTLRIPTFNNIEFKL